MIRLSLLLVALASLPLPAEPRLWRSADGSSSFRGEYVSHDPTQVSIRREDGRLFQLALDKLHADDRAWLARRDLPEPENAPPGPSAVFDSLNFGDTRKEVEAKLKASDFVEATIAETFFGRLGLNGAYRTRRKIGGLHCELYFDWAPDGGLKEISLQTQSLDADAYPTRLRENWSELIEVLTQLHGKPLQTAKYPDPADLQDGLFLASHLWHLDDGGSALLGTSMQTGRYQVVVRFTTERLQPVRVP